MLKQKTPNWPQIALDSWIFAGEVSAVIWLRSVKLLMGGKQAEEEARLMVEEKVSANLAFLPVMLQGGIMQSPERISARALAHYHRPVLANRRRLGGEGR